MRPRCVITGLALISPADDAWIAGDLFDAGSVWIFNGNCEGGRPAWLYEEPHYQKHITPTGVFWERRGVFVIPKEDAQLNSAALEYMERAL